MSSNNGSGNGTGKAFTANSHRRTSFSISFDNETIDAVNEKVGNRKGPRSQFIENAVRKDLGLPILK